MPVFTLEDGYILLKNENCLANRSSSLLSLRNISGETTVQIVEDPGLTTVDETTCSGYDFVLHGVSLRFSSMTGGIGTSGGYSGVKSKVVAPPTKAPVGFANGMTDFTFLINHPAEAYAAETATSATGSVSVLRGTEEVFQAAVEYSEALSDLTYFGMGASRQAIYAIRTYEGGLSADEIAQNHFADLAKYFRLDIGFYTTLASSVKQQIHAAVADLTFDASPEEVKAAMLTVIKANCYADYYIPDEAVTAGAFTREEADLINRYVDLAADCGTDISRLVILPKEYLLRALRELDEDFANNIVTTDLIVSYYLTPITDTIYAEIKAAVATEPTVYTPEDYRKLYVRQDRLLVWIDFFSSTEEMNTTGPAVTGTKPATILAANCDPSDPFSGVLRRGLLSFANNSFAGTMRGENPGDRAFGDGYFFTKGHANLMFWPFLTEGQAASRNSTDMTFEFVYDVLPTGSLFGTNLQLDGARFGSGLQNGQFVLDYSVVENHAEPSADGTSASGNTTLSNREAGTKFVSSADTAHSFTYALHKDRSNHPVIYYKLTWDAAQQTYANHDYTQQEISESEARALYGENFDADFAEKIAELPMNGHIIKDCAGQEPVNGKPVKLMAYRYPASMDYTTYLDGNLAIRRTGRMYPNDSYLMGLGSSTDAKWYSIRQYDVVLTEAEILQNHFADVARYYGLDITLYLALDEAGRAAVHTAMRHIQVAGNADVAAEAYRAALKDTYYSTLKITAPEDADETLRARVEEYNRMIDLCGQYGLNVSAFAGRSEEIRLAYAYALESFETEGSYVGDILQLSLNGIVAPEATGIEKTEGLIRFEGYSVRLSDTVNDTQYPGIRAIYTVDADVLEALAAEYGDALSFGVRVSGGKTATVTAYENGGYREDFKTLPSQDGSVRFAVTVLFENEEFQTAERFGTACRFTPFVKLSETEEYSFDSRTEDYDSGEVDFATLYGYAFDYAEYNADETVRKVLATVKGKAPVTMTVNGVNAAACTVVYDNRYTEAEARAIAAVIAEKVGVRVSVIFQGALMSPSDLGGSCIWLRDPGLCGTVEGEYGMMTAGNAAVLFANFASNNGGNAAGLAEAFANYLESSCKVEDGNYVFETPTDIAPLSSAPVTPGA